MKISKKSKISENIKVSKKSNISKISKISKSILKSAVLPASLMPLSLIPSHRTNKIADQILVCKVDPQQEKQFKHWNDFHRNLVYIIFMFL